MTPEEAVAECNRWLAHLEGQKAKSIRMQELAAMARQGPEQQKQAQRELHQMDRQPKVYDGANLEKAVKALLDERDRYEEILQNAIKVRSELEEEHARVLADWGDERKELKAQLASWGLGFGDDQHKVVT